jgi:5-methyltetrahydrofolate--homocysteine methyltransferase
MADLNALAEAIIKGKAPVARQLTEEALAEGVAPQTVLNDGLIAGMNVVGQKFKANEYYVPEVLIAARAMQQSLQVLKPKLAETGAEPIGKVVIGTVQGDLHDIGKNLVAMMLEGAGFEIIDLGVDVKPEAFVTAALDKGAQIVGMSALLTTTMPAMETTINQFKEQGVREKVKIMIGGAPVTQEFANRIGADGYAPDAASAVDLAKALIAA